MDSVLPGSAVDDIKFQDECRNLETASCVHVCEKTGFAVFSEKSERGYWIGGQRGCDPPGLRVSALQVVWGAEYGKKMCKYIADVQFVASTRSNAHVKKSLVKFYSTFNNFPLIFSR